jgi:hypothetical protein
MLRGAEQPEITRPSLRPPRQNVGEQAMTRVSVYLGMVADDNPIYQGGWKFIMGKNLNPNLARSEAPPRAP